MDINIYLYRLCYHMSWCQLQSPTIYLLPRFLNFRLCSSHIMYNYYNLLSILSIMIMRNWLSLTTIVIHYYRWFRCLLTLILVVFLLFHTLRQILWFSALTQMPRYSLCIDLAILVYTFLWVLTTGFSRFAFHRRSSFFFLLCTLSRRPRFPFSYCFSFSLFQQFCFSINSFLCKQF